MKTQTKYITVPLTPAQKTAAKHVLNLRSSVQWRICPCTPDEEQGVTADVMSESRCVGRGRWRTVTHANHTAQVVNCVQIMAKGKQLKTWLLCTLTGKTRVNVWTVPQGWTIRCDYSSLVLVADDDPQCDWHVSITHVVPFFERCKKGEKEWMEIARKNAVTRRLLEQQMEMHRLEKEAKAEQQRHYLSFFKHDSHKNTRVTLRDSRNAGNCVVGSLEFAKRHKLSEEHVTGLNCPGMRGDVLLRSGDYRAKDAVFAAWQRETTICI